MSALTDSFTAIANAIRNKKGVSTKYTPDQMPDAIASIQTGTDTSDATLDSGSRMLSNYTAYAKGTKYTGSMVNRGAVSQVLNPGGSYTVPAGYHDGNGTVSARNLNLQTKTQTVTPSANWSGTNTNNATINKDSSYDGMSQVNVNVPMLRDNTLMTADTVDAPGTVYNGNTSESNTQKLLRMHPTKDGMSYTGSYLYMKPNSYLGDATAADVVSGKTFSSSSGIQVVGGMITQTASDEYLINSIDESVTKKTYPAGYYPNSWTVSLGPKGGSGKKVWENSSPSSNFNAQTINLNSVISEEKCLGLIIRWRSNKAYTWGSSITWFYQSSRGAQYLLPQNDGAIPLISYYQGDYFVRYVKIASSSYNSLIISNCYKIGAATTHEGNIIPTEISAITSYRV